MLDVEANQWQPLAQARLTHVQSSHKLVMLFWVSVHVYRGNHQQLFENMCKYHFKSQGACVLTSHGKHQRFEPNPKACQCSVGITEKEV